MRIYLYTWRNARTMILTTAWRLNDLPSKIEIDDFWIPIRSTAILNGSNQAEQQWFPLIKPNLLPISLVRCSQYQWYKHKPQPSVFRQKETCQGCWKWGVWSLWWGPRIWWQASRQGQKWRPWLWSWWGYIRRGWKRRWQRCHRNWTKLVISWMVSKWNWKELHRDWGKPKWIPLQDL